MSANRSSGKGEFYGRYRLFLANQGVADKAIPYYVRHLERWGEHLRKAGNREGEAGNGGAGVGRERIFADWLILLGGIPRLEDWQIRQAADAVRLAHAGLLKEG